MQWIEISIVCKRVASDEVPTLFGHYADNGIIEEDIENEPTKQKFVLYVDPTCNEDEVKQDLQNILRTAHIDVHSIESHILDEETWYNSWQQYIEPVEILPHIVIKPAWQEYNNEEHKDIIEIDTDVSFGTGSHETTQYCARLLQAYVANRGDQISQDTCLDIGTGTGILLLVAAKLGISNLVGIDIDEGAAQQAVINIRTNDVDATIIHGDLAKDFNDVADIILANLTVDPLKLLLPVIGDKLRSTGTLIISGIIDERYDEIMPYITEHWHIEKELVEGQWHTFQLSKK